MKNILFFLQLYSNIECMKFPVRNNRYMFRNTLRHATFHATIRTIFRATFSCNWSCNFLVQLFMQLFVQIFHGNFVQLFMQPFLITSTRNFTFIQLCFIIKHCFPLNISFRKSIHIIKSNLLTMKHTKCFS